MNLWSASEKWQDKEAMVGDGRLQLSGFIIGGVSAVLIKATRSFA